MTLGACGAPLAAQTTPTSPTQAWTDYIASLETDDFGSYKLVGGEWVTSDEGFRLGIEAREYVPSGAVRFVVLEDELAKRAEPTGGMVLTLAVDGQDGRIVIASVEVSADDSAQASHPGPILATDYFQRVDQLSGESHHRCAVLSISYNSDAYFDRELTACL